MKLTPLAKVILALIIIGAVGYGVWNNRDKLPIKDLKLPFSSNQTTTEQSNSPVISTGEKVLGVTNEYKTAGAQAYKDKNYENAAVEFNKAVSSKRNDGEAYIYLQNTNIMMTKSPYYKIATAGSFSGKYGQKGEAILQGLAYVQKMINSQGGIGGKKLFIVIGDDQSTTEGAIPVAKELVKDKEILAVIGHIASSATLAAAPIYEANQLTMISSSSGSPAITHAGQYIFRVIPSDDANGKILASYVFKNLKVKKIGIFKDSADQYSQGLATVFSSQFTSLGGKVVDTKEFSTIPVINLSAVQAIAKAGAEGVLVAGSAAAQGISIADAVKNSAPNLKVISGHALYIYELLTEGKASVEGMYVSSPWHAKVNKPEVQSYAKDFNDFFGGQANARSALASDVLFLIASILEKNPDADRQMLMTKLSEVGTKSPAFEGTTGTTAFDKNGDVVKPIVILQIKSNNFIPIAVFNG